MEAFALYLLKSVIWLSGFSLVFLLFLKNERFFTLKRLFLVWGLLTSLLLPLVTIHYKLDTSALADIQTGNISVTEYQESARSVFPDMRVPLLILYLSGVLFFTFTLIKQSGSILRAIRKAEFIDSRPAKLIRTSGYTPSFSFFSYVFVNPSVSEIEAREILNHEMVHIDQMHWIDLVLAQIILIMQWFNPLAWIYFRSIKQNHEYLADEVALQRTSDPAIYKAALLNQIVGTSVISVANSFNYSLNKKRFNMMKNTISSPYRKMRLFLILPVFALVLYAFAKPELRAKPVDENSITPAVATPGVQQKEVRGRVVHEGEALPGATIIIRGTTMGAVTDAKGSFKLANVPEDGSIVVSFVGFKSKVIKPDFSSEMKIEMVTDTIHYGGASAVPPPPPPPPTPPGTLANGPQPLVYIDGVISKDGVKGIDPNTIESINVLKDAVAAYGEKGRNGVILITTKKNAEMVTGDKNKEVTVTGYAIPQKDNNEVVTTNKNSDKVTGDKNKEVVVTGYAIPKKDDNELFVVVEELPQFPGGADAMSVWLRDNIKYPADAAKKGITGEVQVKFLVTQAGKISNVAVSKSVNPLLDAEAVRVISSMPDWKPGKQGGKTVSVYMKMPVNFALK